MILEALITVSVLCLRAIQL